MNHWNHKFLAVSTAVIMALSVTACEPYDEWEARVERERAQQEQQETPQTSTENNYKGPNLADYVNNSLEEAKKEGIYHESDYSNIRTDVEMSSQSDGISDDVLEYLAGLEYEDEPYIIVNDDIPYFTDEDLKLTYAFEEYSELDELGRTGQAYASINKSLMPKEGETRGDISSVKPTGWVQTKYDGIGNGGWLYNRCHLIAWSLANENDNERNLMTGTRYFNVEGMLPFEMQALEYVHENPDNHLLYRATPVYEDEDLLAKGLLLEAYSIEDEGELSFCVFLFNVQPGITINYETGESLQ